MKRRSGRLIGGRLAPLALATLVGLSGGLLGPLRGDALADPLPVTQMAGPARQAGCEFRFGFKEIRDRLSGIVGECIENERIDLASGDTVQRTTTGQLTWRVSDNVPAFTDGHRTWLIGPFGLQDRLNNERFAWEPPAPDTNTIRATQPTRNRRIDRPTTYVYETLEEPPALASGIWPCLRQNPSCAREPWWAEWNDLQVPEPIQYRFLGPGFVTEYRFAEAVGLLWQWPEGKDLLRAAADHGVTVIASPRIPRAAFAGYAPPFQTIVFNPQFTETSTWMVASVLAHELKHAMDDRGGVRQGTSHEDCVTREQEAYKVEARFALWLYNQQGEFPTLGDLQRLKLSNEDIALYKNLARIASSDNPESLALEDYRGICSPPR